jgi:peptidoglycan hydrolase-like protein with peptidoglycan-binding domain
MNIKDLQSRLARASLYGGTIDGIDGPRTAQAIEGLILAQRVVAGDWREWNAARRQIAAAQIFCLLDGIEVGAIDGLEGPQTRHAFEVYAARQRGIEGVENWRDFDDTAPDPRRGAGAPAPSAARRNFNWPRQSHSEMEKFFGPVGTNQATLVLPEGYPMRVAWDLAKTITRFVCHEKICAPARRVFVRVLDHYGPARIAKLGLDRFGGCLNVRRMRGGSAWSTHVWGAAFDFDPERNQLKWNRTQARFARPEYEKWWSLWEDEGFASLGRARDFDWMHVQAACL